MLLLKFTPPGSLQAFLREVVFDLDASQLESGILLLLTGVP